MLFRSEAGDRVIFRIVGHVVVVSLVMALLGGAYILNELNLLTPNSYKLDKIVNWKPDDNTIIYDREGNKISELFNSYHVFYPYEELPQGLVNGT